MTSSHMGVIEIKYIETDMLPQRKKVVVFLQTEIKFMEAALFNSVTVTIQIDSMLECEKRTCQAPLGVPTLPDRGGGPAG